jgi:hypothetical protein
LSGALRPGYVRIDVAGFENVIGSMVVCDLDGPTLLDERPAWSPGVDKHITESPGGKP